MRKYIIYQVLITTMIFATCQEEEIEAIPSYPNGPILLSPSKSELMDNGCYNQSDSMTWEFKVKDADLYHLFVIGENATYPVIDSDSIDITSYKFERIGYVAPLNISNWTWKVRARVNGKWTEWSTAVFSVEAMDTDC